MNTEMMNTRHTAEVIQRLVAANPARMLEGGDVVMPPARLSFGNLAKPGKNMNDPTKEGKFGANLLFTPEADLQVLQNRRLAVVKEAFPMNPTGAGMKNPFRNQADRVAPAFGGMNAQGKSTPGYVPGCAFIAPTGNRRPQLFTGPIVNGVPTMFVGDEAAIEKEFYSGCWIIAVVNAYASKNTANPGVFFGLQSVLKVMDDNEFKGAGGVDPRAAFGGVAIDSNVSPNSLF
jgi:hypothetical protein